jgi:AAHS family 4-hydroxybenzoate transporter-like MFS transporter
MINRLDPSQAATKADIFILGDEENLPGKARVRQLFAGELRLLTPLLWLGFMASSIAIYFVNSWGPLLLETLHYDRSTAALATAFGGIMGSAAGLAIMRFTDRLGSITLIFYPLLLLPVLFVIGLADMSAQRLLWLAMLVLMLVGGMHFVIMSIIGSFYPTAIRGSGSGWASSIGKLGGVLGPMIGGALLASGMPVTRTYLVLSVCPAVILMCSILIFRSQRKGAAQALFVEARESCSGYPD